jgi:hypothetical protein
MKFDVKRLKKEIPETYHFLLHNRLIRTDMLQERHRTKELNRASFNECEQCRYDLLSPEAYQSTTRELKRHPVNGYVHYFHSYRKALCDKCVDQLNGQTWGGD